MLERKALGTQTSQLGSSCPQHAGNAHHYIVKKDMEASRPQQTTQSFPFHLHTDAVSSSIQFRFGLFLSPASPNSTHFHHVHGISFAGALSWARSVHSTTDSFFLVRDCHHLRAHSSALGGLPFRAAPAGQDISNIPSSGGGALPSQCRYQFDSSLP